jgi:serine/threonine protein kinase
MPDLLDDRYQILNVIGAGGMATVYRAKDLKLDRYVAIKVLREEYTEDETFRRHFKKEAVAIAQLSHNNIVGIYDILTDGHMMCLVMEYIEGETLKERINREGPLPWRQVVKYGIQIANGLAYAHSQKIIHKDVKSQNILIDHNDNVKITDFGISQMMNNTTITHNKGILGSAHYFSPEQARGERLSYQTDIYSLGIVLYELLTGSLPFTGDNPVSVALKHIQEEPEPVSSKVRGVPEGLSQIVMKCLQKDPSDRFQTMQAVSRALSSVSYPEEKAYATTAYKGVASGAAVGEILAAHHGDQGQTESLDNKHSENSQNNVQPSINKPAAKSHKGTRILMLAAIVVLVLAGTLFAAQFLFPPSEATVPNLQGMTVSEAQSKLERMDLKLSVSDEQYSDDYDKDEIISQSPTKNTNIQKGQTVTVVVSKGAKQSKVPSVTGMTLEQATSLLAENDLKVGKVTQSYSNTVSSGLVISQSRDENSSVKHGSSIDLVVSIGRETRSVTVPAVTGSSLEEAQQAITSAGLAVGSISYENSDEPEGTVISQSPASGKSLDENSTVNLVISSGPAHQEDPNSGHSNHNNGNDPGNSNNQENSGSNTGKSENNSNNTGSAIIGIL